MNPWLTAVFLLGWLAASSFPAASDKVTIERVSTDSGNLQIEGPSLLRGVSDDGRWVLFLSGALGHSRYGHDPSGFQDAFVKDLKTGVTETIPTPLPADAPAGSLIWITGQTITRDGRYVGYHRQTSAPCGPNYCLWREDDPAYDRQTQTTLPSMPPQPQDRYRFALSWDAQTGLPAITRTDAASGTSQTYPAWPGGMPAGIQPDTSIQIPDLPYQIGADRSGRYVFWQLWVKQDGVSVTDAQVFYLDVRSGKPIWVSGLLTPCPNVTGSEFRDAYQTFAAQLTAHGTLFFYACVRREFDTDNNVTAERRAIFQYSGAAQPPEILLPGHGANPLLLDQLAVTPGGKEVLFTAMEPLISEDTNNNIDVYEWIDPADPLYLPLVAAQ